MALLNQVPRLRNLRDRIVYDEEIVKRKMRNHASEIVTSTIRGGRMVQEHGEGEGPLASGSKMTLNVSLRPCIMHPGVEIDIRDA